MLKCSKGLLEEGRTWSWELEVRSTTVSRAAQPSEEVCCTHVCGPELCCVGLVEEAAGVEGKTAGLGGGKVNELTLGLQLTPNLRLT